MQSQPELVFDTCDIALTPFHLDDSGTFHTSNTTRSTRAFGYTYPELLDWNTDPTTLASGVKGHINNLYGPKITNSKRRSEAQLTVAEMRHDYSINAVVNGYAIFRECKLGGRD